MHAQKYHSIAATGHNADALVSAAATGKPEQPLAENDDEAMHDAPEVSAPAVVEPEEPSVAENVPAGNDTEHHASTDTENRTSNDTKLHADAEEERRAEAHAATIEIPDVPDLAAAAPAAFPFAQQHPAGPAAGFAVGGSMWLRCDC